VCSLATAPKAVRLAVAFAVAVIDQLDLHDAFALALLSKEGVDNDAPALSDVVDPILVDQALHRDGFALPIEALE
jgi:hypothetical protein